MASSGFTWESDKPSAPAGNKGGFNWTDEDKSLTTNQKLAKQAQPTEFERERANESATPWTDIAKGVGEGALGTTALVGKGISKIPYIGSKVIPSAGLNAEQQLATARTPGEKLGSSIESVAETALPIGEVGEAIKGSKYVRPAARFVAENVLPEIKSIPYIGRGIEAAEKAPSFAKAAIRGGTTGALLGGVEQGIRTRSPEEAIKGALYGGAGGALMGMGAHGINRLAAPGITSAEPFRLTPEIPTSEPAVQTPLHFPKATPSTVSSEPFNLTSPVAEREPAVQMPMNIPAAEKPPTLNDLGRQIEQTSGWKPIQSNVTLREQIPPRTAVIPRAPLGSRVAVPVGEEFGPLTKKMGEIPRAVTEEPMRQMGAPPMRPGVSLREQPKTAEAPIRSEQARLEEKYSDKAIRQMVHANGEEMVDAIGNDADTMKAVHNLTNPDVRQAMINSGEDMGQMGINNRKLEGGGSMSRQAAFKKMLSKGLTPQQIVEFARKPIEAR